MRPSAAVIAVVGETEQWKPAYMSLKINSHAMDCFSLFQVDKRSVGHTQSSRTRKPKGLSDNYYANK